MIARARLVAAGAAAALVALGPLHAQQASLTSEVSRLKAAGFEIVTVLPESPGNLFLVVARKPTQ